MKTNFTGKILSTTCVKLKLNDPTNKIKTDQVVAFVSISVFVVER